MAGVILHVWKAVDPWVRSVWKEIEPWVKSVFGLLLLLGVGIPLMAAGGVSGAITVWHLEEKRLSTVIGDAHDGPVVSERWPTVTRSMMQKMSVMMHLQP